MDEEKLLRTLVIALSVAGLVASSIMSVQTGAEVIGLFGIIMFGSEEKQNELYRFEIKVATLIDEGFITNYENLMNYLRNQYARKHKPF